MKYQDIQVSDLALQQQFVSYWMNNQCVEALQLLETNPQLDSKKFVSEVLSRIANSIIAIENLYKTDFTNALNLELDNFNEIINQFLYTKNWNSSTNYKIGNSVLKNKDIYVCIKENNNISPPNDEYWVFLGLKGDKGGSGIGVTIQFDWDKTKNYNKNDIVVFDSYLWCALQPNLNKEPNETSIYWSKFLEIPKIKLIVSKVQPKVLYDGMIWLEIIE